ALILAAAGLERLGLQDAPRVPIPAAILLPAPGQGALGLEIRADDARTRRSLAPLDDPASAAQVTAERAVLAALEGGCQVPVAAYARSPRLYGRVTALDGTIQLTASAELDARDPAAAGAAVAALLRAQGAPRLLGR
ncbi:MAG: hydroxymethylbilane synthase, partial [Gemmatimonadales bacterium]